MTMEIRKYLLPLASAIMLGACSTSPIKPDPNAYPIGARLIQSQKAIANAKAQVDRSNPTFAAVKGETPLGDNTTPTTIVWNGDARDLLLNLTKRNHLTFHIVGLIGPLPVMIDVHNEPLNHVLGTINQQITHRGLLALERPMTLTLQYLPTTGVDHAGAQP